MTENPPKVDNWIVKSILLTLHAIFDVLGKGISTELKKIEEGSYKNSFFLTKIILGLFLWLFCYKYFGLGKKVSFSWEKALDYLQFLSLGCLIDILINPYKEVKFLLRITVTIFFTVVSIRACSFLSDNLAKSLREPHQENIIKQKDDKQ